MRRRHPFCAIAILILILALFVSLAPLSAQQIPPPTAPVLFCGQQTPPAATSYAVSVDSGTPITGVTLTAPPDFRCPAGSTHSFELPAALFSVGEHRVAVTAINAFGSTAGPQFVVTVGIAPGPFTVTAVIPPPEL